MKTVIKSEDRPSLSDQIAEIQRELKMRERVYPRQIHSGKLKSAVAYTQSRNMSAALDTLLWLQNNSQAVKDAHEKIKESA